MRSKIAQNLSGSKRDSPPQIKCENFITGGTVGFRTIVDQKRNSVPPEVAKAIIYQIKAYHE